MGASVSVENVRNIPDFIDRKRFYELTGMIDPNFYLEKNVEKLHLPIVKRKVYDLTSIEDEEISKKKVNIPKKKGIFYKKPLVNAFTDEAYDCFVDRTIDKTGVMSKERFLEVVSSFDCFLSHDWGIDMKGRQTHDRVKKIQQYLKSKGIFAYLDDAQMHNKNSDLSYLKTKERITHAIEKSQFCIIFMTRNYNEKLCQATDNDVKTEFFTSFKTKGFKFVLPVVFEDDVSLSFTRLLYAKDYVTNNEFTSTVLEDKPNVLMDHFKETYCVNMTDFERDHNQYEELYDNIVKAIRPYRLGGHYNKSKFIYSTTVEGRHYNWLKNHISSFDYKTVRFYSSVFAENNIDSITRLSNMLINDPDLLIKLEIPEADAEIIKSAIKIELEDNLQWRNIKEIGAIIEKQREKLDAEKKLDDEEAIYHIEKANLNKENVCMSKEDSMSSFRREVEKSMATIKKFNEEKRRIVLAIEEYKEIINTSIETLQLNLQQKIEHELKEKQIAHEIKLSNLGSPDEVCTNLRMIIARIEYAVENLPVPITTNTSTSTNYFDISYNDTSSEESKKNKVKSFLDTIDSDSLNNLLRESTLLFHEITIMCRKGKADAVLEFLHCGIVKVVMSIFSSVYLFKCDFSLPYIQESSYHNLAMPIEGLRAIRYICKYDFYNHTSNSRLIYLFGEAGTIEMILECIKFHFEDLDIIEKGIDCLLVLLDSLENESNHLKIIDSNDSNYMLLMILLEKYPSNLVLQSSIVMILSLLLRNDGYDYKLELYRVFMISPIIMDVINYLLKDNGELIDVSFKMLCCIQNLFYDHVNNYTNIFTPVNPNENIALNKKLIKNMDNFIIIDFIVKQLKEHPNNEYITMASLHALTNLVYNNEENKLYCSKLNIQELSYTIIRSNIEYLKSIYHQNNSDDFTWKSQVYKDAIISGQLLCSNLIILSSFDTFENRQSAAYKEFKKPVEVQGSPIKKKKEKKYIINKYDYGTFQLIQYGIAEVLLQILISFTDDKDLLKSGLMLLCRLVYKGKFFSCARLTSLGFCEKLIILIRDNWDDKEIYVMGLAACSGLASSHAVLVGSGKKLLKAGVCDIVTSGLKNTCKVSGLKKWTHFSYPYVCNVCIESCHLVYHMTHQGTPLEEVEAIDLFKKTGFQGILVKPPIVVSEMKSLENFMRKDELLPVEDPFNLNSELKAMVPYNNLSPSKKNSIVKSYRNIEYCPVMNRKEKDDIMYYIFNIFNVN